MGAGAILLAGCGGAGRHQPSGAIPRNLLLEARPIGAGPRFHPPVRGPVPGTCRRRLGPRLEAHVEVFAADRVVIVPAGIGLRPPVRLAEGRITGARCFGALVTLEPTGVVLVRPGRTLRVADLFRAWGFPLTAERLAGFAAPPGERVRAYLAGRPWPWAAGDVPLSAHAEIVLEVGPYVPPHRAYTFAPPPDL